MTKPRIPTTRYAHKLPGRAFVSDVFFEKCVTVGLPLAVFARVLLHPEMFACNVPIQVMRFIVCVRAADKRAIECGLMKVHVEHDVLNVHVRFCANATGMPQVGRVFVQFFRVFHKRQMHIIEMLNEINKTLKNIIAEFARYCSIVVGLLARKHSNLVNVVHDGIAQKLIIHAIVTVQTVFGVDCTAVRGLDVRAQLFGHCKDQATARASKEIRRRQNQWQNFHVLVDVRLEIAWIIEFLIAIAASIADCDFIIGIDLFDVVKVIDGHVDIVDIDGCIGLGWFFFRSQ